MGVKVGVEEGVKVKRFKGVNVGVRLGVGETVSVGEAVAVLVPVCVGVLVRVREAIAVGVIVRVRVGDDEGVAVAEAVAMGLFVAVEVGMEVAAAAAETAALRFISPQPLCWFQVPWEPMIWAAVVARICETPAGDREGLTASIRAAPPVTKGAEAEVPEATP